MISISHFSNLSRIIRALENSDYANGDLKNTAFDNGDMESIHYDDQDSINQDRDHFKEIEELYKEEVKIQRRSHFRADLSSKKLKEAIIWSELLGPPLSKRRHKKVR